LPGVVLVTFAALGVLVFRPAVTPTTEGQVAVSPPASESTAPALPAPSGTATRNFRRPLEPVLVMHCGKPNPPQPELSQPGYGCHLVQGTAYNEWPATAPRTYCWYDGAKLQFQIKVPAGTALTLRFFFLDADASGRQQRLVVQGRTVDVIANFAGGKELDVPIGAHEAPAGKIDVILEKLAGPNAVVSQVEVLVPAGGAKR
jgi:hypothetical protein